MSCAKRNIDWCYQYASRIRGIEHLVFLCYAAQYQSRVHGIERLHSTDEISFKSTSRVHGIEQVKISLTLHTNKELALNWCSKPLFLNVK